MNVIVQHFISKSIGADFILSVAKTANFPCLNSMEELSSIQNSYISRVKGLKDTMLESRKP